MARYERSWPVVPACNTRDDADVLLVETATMVIAAVTLLMQRLDRRADQSPDIREALLETYSIVDDWATLAGHVNSVFEAAKESGEPVDGAFDAFDGFRQQAEYVKAFDHQTRVDGSRHDRSRSVELLAVYAPEVRDALLEAAAIRADVVYEVMADYNQVARAGGVNGDQLATSAENLRSAAESLRDFIARTFPIDNSKG